MINIIENSVEETQYLIDTVHVLSDEGVIDRIRQIERILWTNDLLPETVGRLHRYSKALREEALKRMREGNVHEVSGRM